MSIKNKMNKESVSPVTNKEKIKEILSGKLYGMLVDSYDYKEVEKHLIHSYCHGDYGNYLDDYEYHECVYTFELVDKKRGIKTFPKVVTHESWDMAGDYYIVDVKEVVSCTVERF